jgi:hypothetical protein
MNIFLLFLYMFVIIISFRSRGLIHLLFYFVICDAVQISNTYREMDNSISNEMNLKFLSTKK